MRTLKTWDLESNIADFDNTIISTRVCMVSIKPKQMIKVAELFTYEGEKLYIKGTLEDEDVVRYIELSTIAKESEEWFIATSTTGKEYHFSLYHRYDFPTLLGWFFEDEDDGQGVDWVLNHHMDYVYEKPVTIMGYSAEIPGHKDGSGVFVGGIKRLSMSSTYDNLLVAFTENEWAVCLPLDQRLGFIHAESVNSWGLKVDCTSRDDIKQLSNQMENMFHLCGGEDGVIMDKVRLDIPSNLQLSMIGENAPSGIIKAFIRIIYLGSIKYYVQTKDEIREIALANANDDIKNMLNPK